MTNVRHIVVIASLVLLGAGSSLAQLPSFTPWSTPTNLGHIVNTAGNDSGPCISKDGLSLFFNSNGLGGYGGLDIFVSHRASVNDPWGPPQNLGSNINSASTDNAVCSARPGSFSSLSDIWVSTRTNTSQPWSTPINLGPEINLGSTYYQGKPSISFDGRTMYLYAAHPDSFGVQDLYVSTRTKLKN